MNDNIVDEVRRVRDAHAAKFNYDLDAIFRDIKEQEAESGSKLVSLAASDSDLEMPQQSVSPRLDVSAPVGEIMARQH